MAFGRHQVTWEQDSLPIYGRCFILRKNSSRLLRGLTFGGRFAHGRRFGCRLFGRLLFGPPRPLGRRPDTIGQLIPADEAAVALEDPRSPQEELVVELGPRLDPEVGLLGAAPLVADEVDDLAQLAGPPLELFPVVSGLERRVPGQAQGEAWWADYLVLGGARSASRGCSMCCVRWP